MDKTTRKTRAINVRVNFIRQYINNRIIELPFISSKLNLADIMTMQLSVENHERHTYRLLYGFDGLTVENLKQEAHRNEYRLTKITKVA